MDNVLGPYDHLISLRRFIDSIGYHLLRIIGKRCCLPVRLYQPTYSQFWLLGRFGVSFTYSIHKLQGLISKWTNSPYTLMNFDWENGVGLSFKCSKCVLKIDTFRVYVCRDWLSTLVWLPPGPDKCAVWDSLSRRVMWNVHSFDCFIVSALYSGLGKRFMLHWPPSNVLTKMFEWIISSCVSLFVEPVYS